MSQMMYQYFEQMESGIAQKLAAEPAARSPRKILALETARLGQRLYGNGGRVAWCGVAAPFDLLSAMGITSCFVEFVGATLASTGMVGSFLQQAEQAGYAGDTCGYHRAVLGAASQGLMPVPDFLVATSTPCAGGVAVVENLARHFERDLFVLNIPQEATAGSVAYLADQLRELVDFVSAHTGEVLDNDRLHENMLRTNQARELMAEVYRLARQVPSPIDSRTLANFTFGMALLLGSDAAIEVAREFRDDLTAKVARGRAGIADERLRLLWIQNRIQFKNPLVEMLEKEYGAVIVADELNSITWEPIDPDDPYPGLARRAISLPLNGPGRNRVEHLQRMATDYRVDGAINPCHWGCRQGTGARGLIAEGLKQVGVPVLNLEVDCVDQRNFTEGQLRTRLQAFAEMLEGRSSPWDETDKQPAERSL